VPLPVPDEVLQEIAKLVIAKAKAALEKKGVKNIEVRLLDGSPADQILSAAEHEKADMIVMGSRGLGKFADLLMGSVSHRVSHLAPCTCVTVK
jgi:nucleotide-binding universal stress UspA family protein